MGRTKCRETCKDATITVRVSSEEKNKIKKKAKKENKSASEYILDAAMAGLERRNSKDKRRVVQMVRNQEILNDIFELSGTTDIATELQDKIRELMEGENGLWQCL